MLIKLALQIFDCDGHFAIVLCIGLKESVCFNEVKELELAFLDPDFKCEELILKAGWDLRSFQQMHFMHQLHGMDGMST